MTTLSEKVQLFLQAKAAAVASQGKSGLAYGTNETAEMKQFNEVCSLIYCEAGAGPCNKVSWNTFRSTPLADGVGGSKFPQGWPGLHSWVENYLTTETIKAGGAAALDKITGGSSTTAPSANLPATGGSFLDKIPTWGWIVGGVVISGGLLGIIAVASKPKKKALAGLAGYRRSRRHSR